jgi:pimeloyl-ACP methyl ester carboxylesterase
VNHPAGSIYLLVLAVLIVSAAGVYNLFARDLSLARARLAGHSETLQTSVGTLEYSVRGAGEPILAIHGAGGGFDQAIDMTGALVEHEYRLIAPSRFGYLRSSLPAELTVAMQADAYAELLDHLGIDQAVVVGISAGAWSSMQFAIRHPQRCRALVLIVPADYLPAGTAVHGGAFVTAMISSDFFAWAALRLMPIMPGAMGAMLGTAPAVVRSADAGEKARIGPIAGSPAAREPALRRNAVRHPYGRRARAVLHREDRLPGPDDQCGRRPIRHGRSSSIHREQRGAWQSPHLPLRWPCAGGPLCCGDARKRRLHQEPMSQCS